MVTRWIACSTHKGDLRGFAATGGSLEVTTIGIWLVAEGKISETWLVYDAFGMMQQLGVTS